MARVFVVPVWRHTHGHRPIRRIQPDRRIAIVVELVALVFEVLPKAVQFGPRLMTRRTRQAILTGKCRDRVSGSAAQDDEEQQQSGDENSRLGLLTTHAKAGGHVHTILSASKNMLDGIERRYGISVPGTDSRCFVAASLRHNGGH